MILDEDFGRFYICVGKPYITPKVTLHLNNFVNDN